MQAATHRYNIAIAGYGGVGKAVAKLFLARRARYRELYKADVRLIAVCGSNAGLMNLEGLEASAPPLQAGLTGQDFLNAAPVDILIEAGPTDFSDGGPGLGYMRDALARGRHIIAISKGALVVDGKGLRTLAATSGAQLKVSGATAAALPTIDLLQFNLLGSEVSRIEGILNGTTNYLLTEMMERDMSFADALHQAQQDGIAEPDPSFDVDGWDTACKMVIIANFGLGAELSLGDLTVSGIAHVTPKQLAEWRHEGRVPKLIGHISRTDIGWSGGVELRTYAADEALSLVRGKNKAIWIDTTEMGEIFVAGGASGAGATAAAALKDLEHILAAAPKRHPR
ncbi:MAG: homoserine dehydrogenase [Parasphingorhabdus sp.]|nr:homoserine dehydrogenase [Parasphingorhabdus sp.]